MTEHPPVVDEPCDCTDRTCVYHGHPPIIVSVNPQTGEVRSGVAPWATQHPDVVAAAEQAGPGAGERFVAQVMLGLVRQAAHENRAARDRVVKAAMTPPPAPPWLGGDDGRGDERCEYCGRWLPRNFVHWNGDRYACETCTAQGA